VERPSVLETTAWGAARLAGMQAGVYPPLGTPGLRRVERTFSPVGDDGAGDRLYEGWRREIRRAGGREVGELSASESTSRRGA
jgi:glycerol kinase